MDRWKAEQGRGREKRKSKKKEDAGARKGRKVAKHCVFSWLCGSGGLKSRLAKAAGAEPAVEMRDEKLHAVVARSTFWSHKTHQVRTTFGSWDVEKVHAVVARSTFWSQNVQNAPGSGHFWKLRCRKSARRCGAKHILKSKCTKRTRFGPLLEVEMSKKCTPLWREDARSTFRSQNVKNTRGSDHFWRFRCRFASLHYTLHYTTLHYTTLHYTPLHYNYNYDYTTTLHYTPLHEISLHYTTLHYTTLHYTPLHYITLHCTTFHYTSLHYTTLHYAQLQLHNYTPLQDTPPHSTTLNYITLHYITLHYTPLHYITLHYLPLHFTTLHYTTLQLQLRLHNYTPLHYY